MTNNNLGQFKQDVLAGLSSSPKRLSSKYFYDEIGDDLFVQIMQMTEYYLTRCEFEIFSTQTQNLIEGLEIGVQYFDLFELGAGDGTKTIELLKALKTHKFTYRPIDISSNAIAQLVARVKHEIPEITIEGIQGEYFDALKQLPSKNPKIILFLGSNLGNLTDELAHKFLAQLSESMNIGDKILLGVDLKKSRDIILPAYHDAQGLTAAFNLNLLTRRNKELGGNFDCDAYSHVPNYDEKTGFATSYLKAQTKQEVYISALEKSFVLEAGEVIFTEISRKYDDIILSQILHNTGLSIKKSYSDSKEYFQDIVLEKVA